MKAKGDVKKAKDMLEATYCSYRQIANETGCSYGTVAKYGKEIRNKPLLLDDEVMSIYEKRPTERPSKGIVKELERERDGWKAEHDDLMDKYNKRGEEMEKMHDSFIKQINEKHEELKVEQGIVDRLEEELETYRTDNNPQMCSTLNKRINELHEEIREMHKCCEDADQEKETAEKYAQELKDQLQEHMKRFKEYEMEYEARYLNMKKQRDHYAAVAQLQLEVSE